MAEMSFNPREVEQYFGKTFATKSGSRYGITIDGRFTGRESIEGAEVLLVGGIRPEDYGKIAVCLMPGLKREFDEAILKYGRAVEPGLHLVVSLTQESAEKSGRNGLMTSVVNSIE